MRYGALSSLILAFPVWLFMAQAMARTADIGALFDAAEAEGRVRLAKKSQIVDARPARPGEIVVSMIKGEGKETQSPPAKAGDMVVRNRCEDTGGEEILVTASKFSERYDGPLGAAEAPRDASAGWQPYRPRGNPMKFFFVREEDGSFTFTAPWGEEMVAKPGDAIVRDVSDAKDTYRIARRAFECTYVVLEK